MANGVNKVILVGHLGKDPETRHTNNGTTVCNFSLATTESWKDKQGVKQEKTEWHRCVAWGKLAEICGEYLRKGALVYVEGKLETQQWEKDGETRYTTQVRLEEMRMLGGKGDGQRGERQQSRRDDGAGYGDAGGYGEPSPNYGGGSVDDDIPF